MLNKFKKILDPKKIPFFNNQIILLFILITIVCFIFDFNFPNSNLVIPFVITTLISSFTTFLGIPQLKKIKIKQIIREEGPKNHFLKQGTPTMGGIFIIPIGIIISNLLYFNKEDYKIILTLSFLAIFFNLGIPIKVILNDISVVIRKIIVKLLFVK